MFKDRFWRFMPLMDADGGAAGGTGDGGDGGDGTSAGGNEPMTFDDWLASNPDYQKEFDRRQTKGIKTAVANERIRLNKLHDDQLTEAQRLAAMNEDEKREYLDQKKERELADREAAITKRELMAEAKNTLTEKGLPLSFAEMINYSDAESVKKSIEALEKEWTPAVENSVEDRLKGGTPPKDARTEGDHGEDAKKDEVWTSFGLKK